VSGYLLDTGPLVGLLNGRRGAIDLIEPWMLRHEVTTSILACGEALEYLAGRPDSVARRTALVKILQEIIPRSPGFETVDRYADLRRALRPPYGPGLIGDIDTVIAATALEHDLTLVTIDGDFTRVPGLKVMLLAHHAFVPLSQPSP
jgi:predicted nucleic acid-binding protein